MNTPIHSYTYLNTKEMDTRHLLITGYLYDKVWGSHIVDLNSGHSRLIHHLPKGYQSYMANDINPDCEVQPAPFNYVFYNLSDEEFRHIPRCIDILLLIGITDGGLTGVPGESTTYLDTANYLIKEHNPCYIVMETPYDWERDFQHISHLDVDGYSLDYECVISPPGVGCIHRELSRRLLKFYKK